MMIANHIQPEVFGQVKSSVNWINKMNGLMLAFVVFLAGSSWADPIHLGRTVRSPVGECPSIDGQFPTYLPDSEKCDVFYECSHGVAEPKLCLPGLCFDPVLNVCAYPTDFPSVRDPIGECPPRDTNETIFLTDSQNCSVYYICSNGRPWTSACADGLEWNSAEKTCVEPLDSDCTVGGQRKRSSYKPVGECPEKDTTNTVFLPDSDKCNLYYECSNGVAIQNVCPGEEQWNSQWNTCTLPDESDCGAGKKKQSPYKPVGECPEKDPANPVFLPDSDKCNIYYECSNGVAIQNVCPGVEEWNSQLNTCTLPDQSGCDGGTDAPIMSTSEAPMTTTTTEAPMPTTTTEVEATTTSPTTTNASL